MLKNVAAQKITLFAFDSTTSLPKSADSANLTAYVSKDDGAVTVLGDTSATEIDATNAKGLYTFDLTQSETNGDKLVFSGKSSTSNIAVVPAIVYTLPANFPALGINSSGHVSRVTLADTITTYTGDTPQTGNVYPLILRPPLGSIYSATSTVFQVVGVVGVSGQYTGRRLYLSLAAGGDLYTDPCTVHSESSGIHTFTFANTQRATPSPTDSAMVLGL